MHPRRPLPHAWTAVALVFLFMLINYADKAVIGLSSGQIIREMGLTHTQFGMLGSAFFLLFSVSGVAVGFLANRIRTKTLMLVMSMVWSAALLPMIRASGFAALVGSRVILGAAEGPAFPVAIHAVYKWFDNRRRALPSSIVASGAAFGAGIVAPLVTWIIERYGWHSAFGVLGLAGLAWALLWMILGREGPGDTATDAESASVLDDSRKIPYRRLILSRTAVGVYIAGFAAYWIISLNLVWLANYLIKVLQMAPADAAWVIALPSAMPIASGRFQPGLARDSRHPLRHGRGRFDGVHAVRSIGPLQDFPRGSELFHRQRHFYAGIDADRRDIAGSSAGCNARYNQLPAYSRRSMGAVCDGPHRGHHVGPR
jgi:MFS family permease